MKGKQIIKGVLYASAGLGGVFLLHTEDMTLEQWNAQNWFDLLKLALKMNGAAALLVAALLDNPDKKPV